MARFDKKWWFVHVPASVAVVALIVFGVNQCDSKNDEAAEKTKAQQQLIDAGKKMEIAAGRMDSLLNANNRLGADNVRKGDTIRVLKDSVNTLNGQIVELKQDNDSLTVALTKCKNSKKKSRSKARTKPVAPDSKPVVPSKKTCDGNSRVPCWPVKSCCDTVVGVNTANVHMNGSYNNGNVVVDNGAHVVDVKLENGSVNNGNVIVDGANAGCRKQGRVNVGVAGSRNNGVIVVDGAPKDANVTLDGHAVNNGAIIVGDGNSVYHVTPDTIVRFTTTKNTVVKCRVITKQRQYR